MPYNPVSRQNLQPRETLYQEPKKRHEITVTPEGWHGFQAMAAGLGISCSELIERLGRGSVSLSDVAAVEENLLIVERWDTGVAVDAHGRRHQFQVEPEDRL